MKDISFITYRDEVNSLTDKELLKELSDNHVKSNILFEELIERWDDIMKEFDIMKELSDGLD